MEYLGFADDSFELTIQNYCIKKHLDFKSLANMERIWGIDMVKFKKDNVIVLEVFGHGNNVTVK